MVIVAPTVMVIVAAKLYTILDFTILSYIFILYLY